MYILCLLCFFGGKLRHAMEKDFGFKSKKTLVFCHGGLDIFFFFSFQSALQISVYLEYK